MCTLDNRAHCLMCDTSRSLGNIIIIDAHSFLRTQLPSHVVLNHPCTQSRHIRQHFLDRRLVSLLLLRLSDDECPLYVEKETRIVVSMNATPVGALPA